MLDLERRTFEAEREELLKSHEGRFAAYVGSERVGVFDSYVDAATTAGLRSRGTPALVRRIAAGDPVYFVPSVVRSQ